MISGVLVGLLAAASVAVVHAQAEATVDPGGQIVVLRRGAPAPWEGLLIAQDDLVRWRLEIESLRFRLDAETRRAAAELETRVSLWEARVEAEADRRVLVEGLWQDRSTQLATDLAQAQGAVERAARREWWEHPALWLVVGLVVGAAVVVVAVVSG